MKINKSLLTNGISIIIIPLSKLTGPAEPYLFSVGLFAASGAITNWLAIYMLFEEVPFLYGSGVIPKRFEEFKDGIRELIMEQFFTRDNMDNFIRESEDNQGPIDLAPIVKSINYDDLFNKFVDVIVASPLGGMLGMLGGPKVLDPLRSPFAEKIENTLVDMTESQSFQQTLKDQLHSDEMGETIMKKVDAIVQKRLNELTPQLVKEIIQQMIKEHLGWLVVWGGVFGGLIGLLTALVK